MTLTQVRDAIKAWWPVACIIGGLIVLWGNVPIRLAKAEEQIDDLKGWAKELQGYTRRMQEQQQLPQQAAPRVWQAQDREGNWYCADDQGNWWWPDREGRC